MSLTHGNSMSKLLNSKLGKKASQDNIFAPDGHHSLSSTNLRYKKQRSMKKNGISNVKVKQLTSKTSRLSLFSANPTFENIMEMKVENQSQMKKDKNKEKHESAESGSSRVSQLTLSEIDSHLPLPLDETFGEVEGIKVGKNNFSNKRSQNHSESWDSESDLTSESDVDDEYLARNNLSQGPFRKTKIQRSRSLTLNGVNPVNQNSRDRIIVSSTPLHILKEKQVQENRNIRSRNRKHESTFEEIDPVSLQSFGRLRKQVDLKFRMNKEFDKKFRGRQSLDESDTRRRNEAASPEVIEEVDQNEGDFDDIQQVSETELFERLNNDFSMKGEIQKSKKLIDLQTKENKDQEIMPMRKPENETVFVLKTAMHNNFQRKQTLKKRKTLKNLKRLNKIKEKADELDKERDEILSSFEGFDDFDSEESIMAMMKQYQDKGEHVPQFSQLVGGDAKQESKAVTEPSLKSQLSDEDVESEIKFALQQKKKTADIKAQIEQRRSKIKSLNEKEIAAKQPSDQTSNKREGTRRKYQMVADEIRARRKMITEKRENDYNQKLAKRLGRQSDKATKKARTYTLKKHNKVSYKESHEREPKHETPNLNSELERETDEIIDDEINEQEQPQVVKTGKKRLTGLKKETMISYKNRHSRVSDVGSNNDVMDVEKEPPGVPRTGRRRLHTVIERQPRLRRMKSDSGSVGLTADDIKAEIEKKNKLKNSLQVVASTRKTKSAEFKASDINSQEVSKDMKKLFKNKSESHIGTLTEDDVDKDLLRTKGKLESVEDKKNRISEETLLDCGTVEPQEDFDENIEDGDVDDLRLKTSNNRRLTLKGLEIIKENFEDLEKAERLEIFSDSERESFSDIDLSNEKLINMNPAHPNLIKGDATLQDEFDVVNRANGCFLTLSGDKLSLEWAGTAHFGNEKDKLILGSFFDIDVVNKKQQTSIAQKVNAKEVTELANHVNINSKTQRRIFFNALANFLNLAKSYNSSVIFNENLKDLSVCLTLYKRRTDMKDHAFSEKISLGNSLSNYWDYLLILPLEEKKVLCQLDVSEEKSILDLVRANGVMFKL